MTEDNHSDQPGRDRCNSFGNVIDVQVLRLAIQDFNGITLVADVPPDQTAPQRRLHRRQIRAQFLVNFIPAAWVDQQQVELLAKGR